MSGEATYVVTCGVDDGEHASVRAWHVTPEVLERVADMLGPPNTSALADNSFTEAMDGAPGIVIVGDGDGDEG